MTVLTHNRIRKSLSHAGSRDPDVELMLRVQEDDVVAFQELVDRYSPLVFGRFFRRLNDRQLAEDLTQEVFLRLFRHRKRYQPSAKFTTWLFHITENLFRNTVRSRRRRPMLQLDVLDHGRSSTGWTNRFWTPPDTPSRRMERAELSAQVRRAMATLNGRQRTALEMHQYQDRTYAEIAAELEITPEAAKSLLYRARNQLRENLTPLFEE